MAVLMHNGIMIPDAPSNPRELLASVPRGVYTTTLVHPDKGVADWSLHHQRIRHNALAQPQGSALSDLLHGFDKKHAPVSIRTACEAAWNTQPDPTDLVLFLQLYTDDENTPSLRVHVSPRPAPVPTKDNNVVIIAPPRTNASIKDCQWVNKRRPYEALLPQGACEGLLCNAQGGLTEGLVTNLFVIDKNNTVYTAPDEAVLGGVVRQRVLDACDALGIKVIQQAPAWQDREDWIAAFLTNAIRRVQPLSSIVLFAGCTWLDKDVQPGMAAFDGWRGDVEREIVDMLDATANYTPLNVLETVVVEESVVAD